MRHRIFHGGNLHPRIKCRKQLTTFFCKKNTSLKLLFCSPPLLFNDRTKQQDVVCHANPYWTVILQQLLHISCLRTVIANGPNHCLKGELAGPDVAIHLQNQHLFWRILIKPDLAIGKNIGWQE